MEGNSNVAKLYFILKFARYLNRLTAEQLFVNKVNRWREFKISKTQSFLFRNSNLTFQISKHHLFCTWKWNRRKVLIFQQCALLLSLRTRTMEKLESLCHTRLLWLTTHLSTWRGEKHFVKKASPSQTSFAWLLIFWSLIWLTRYLGLQSH